MAYVSVDVDLNDIISYLSKREKQELVDNLYDDGYEPSQLEIGCDIPSNVHDEMWFEVVDKIRRGRLQLNSEQEALILEIASKII